MHLAAFAAIAPPSPHTYSGEGAFEAGLLVLEEVQQGVVQVLLVGSNLGVRLLL
jgi:hypothetical protein